jgi:hypothetical protein
MNCRIVSRVVFAALISNKDPHYDDAPLPEAATADAPRTVLHHQRTKG